jgi:sugar-specific transcriptional regulator TrmB
MNLNKFTKAELISKFKKLESKNDSNNNQNNFINQIKTYLSQILDLILTFKNILIKITMISFFLQIFKKYRIFRRF